MFNISFQLGAFVHARTFLWSRGSETPRFFAAAESLACLAPGKTRHGACGSGWQVLKATWMGKGKAWVKSCFFLQRMLWILEFVKRFWVKWATLTLWNVFEWRALCSCLNWISSGGFASKGTSQNHWYYTDFLWPCIHLQPSFYCWNLWWFDLLFDVPINCLLGTRDEAIFVSRGGGGDFESSRDQGLGRGRGMSNFSLYEKMIVYRLKVGNKSIL